MRTCVRMGPRPWKPAQELDGALERGELDFAVILAAEVVEDHKRLPLETALRFLPLVVSERPAAYDGWALRWLARWISETRNATIEQAAEVAAALSDLPAEPAMLTRLLRSA
jgi:hypothetical protein